VTVLVVGASGRVGGRVLHGLLEQDAMVRVTTRNPDTVSFPPCVEVFRADLNRPETFGPALQGVERAFLYADLEDPPTLVDQVRASGVQHVVLLSSSATTYPNAEADFNGSRFLRVERAVEQAGVPCTFLRPDTFASNAARWAWSIKSEGVVPLPYPEAVQAPIHEQDIADVAVIALTSNQLVGARPLLTGPGPITLREQVATIGRAIERDLTIVEQTDAEARAALGRHLPAAWVDVIVDGWRNAVGAQPTISPDYTRITGQPGRDFAAWARDNVALFT